MSEPPTEQCLTEAAAGLGGLLAYEQLLRLAHKMGLLSDAERAEAMDVALACAGLDADGQREVRVMLQRLEMLERCEEMRA